MRPMTRTVLGLYIAIKLPGPGAGRGNRVGVRGSHGNSGTIMRRLVLNDSNCLSNESRCSRTLTRRVGQRQLNPNSAKAALPSQPGDPAPQGLRPRGPQKTAAIRSLHHLSTLTRARPGPLLYNEGGRDSSRFKRFCPTQ
eukprot:376132-Hanusia_phi.AAC.1